MIKISLLQ